MGFGEDDIQIIHDSVALLGPLVPGLVDAVYAKLYSYDCTWRHFLPRQHGYEGEISTNLEDLTPDHPQIAFRKDHLARYLVNLVTAPYDAKTVGYVDMVGKIHTPKAGNAAISVPLVPINALMGFVGDALNATILGTDLSNEQKTAMVRAFSELLWLQNDLINRHYV
jgi:hypothetical protein